MLFLLTFSSQIFGADNWLPKTNDFWRVPGNWSLNRAPDQSSGTTYVTNTATNILIKTVTIDALTANTNLLLNGLTLGSPSNSVTNILIIQDLGIDRPLTILNGSELKIVRGGALILTNSSLVLTGGFGASQGFNAYAGTVTLESGFIRMLEDPGETNATTFVRIGRTNVATLTINGGTMEIGSLRLGENLANNPQIRPTGNLRLRGGLLQVAAELSIGTTPQSTGMVEIAGGFLKVIDQGTNIMRIGDEGFGQMVISNGMAEVGNVSVGRHTNSFGALTIYTNGFFIASDDFSIGRFAGATGTVSLIGGTLAVTNHPIWVGREGVGQLNVSNGLLQAAALHIAIVDTNTAQGSVTLAGGRTRLSSNVTIGHPAYNGGRLFVQGGTLDVTNNAGLAFLAVNNGLFEIADGIVSIDTVILTNTTGRLSFNRGTLKTGGTFVSNELPFVVGDGTNPATLFLRGGTHTFANGLVISSNATVAGCGTVIGSITILGTNALDCTSVGEGPAITEQPKNQSILEGKNVQFSALVSGTAPLFYQWLFNGSPIESANSSVYALNTIDVSRAGNYSVWVTNHFGSVTSQVAQLRVLVKTSISQIQPAMASLLLTFGTLTNLNYTVEFKNTLDDPSWTPLFPIIPGTGGPFTFQDTNSSLPSRFYRIRTD
jgi:T5SS/PEP-CTERM-associated repeat protein